MHFSDSFVLTLFIFKKVKYSERDYVCRKYELTGVTPTHTHPWGRPSKALSSVRADMYSDSFSTTTPAAIDIESPDCMK